MHTNITSIERRLYWLAFFIAMGIRFYRLGAAPLSDIEAGWALQALGIARGGSVQLGAQPAYLLLTSQFFSIFGDTNFMARFFPALAGSLLVWLPYYFRRWMGDSGWLHRAGVVMAFGLALDPGLVSLSRQAGSLMPALAFTLLALAALYSRRMVWVGIFAGLALLSGPAFLQEALILAISLALYRLASGKLFRSPSEDGNAEPTEQPISTPAIGSGVVAFVVTIVIAGSLFLRVPQGLGSLADTIPTYLKGWVTSSDIPVLRLPASLLAYQPIVLILGIVTTIRVWTGFWDDQHSRQAVRGLSIWAGVAFFLPWLYAGHQVGDMAWTLVPLWALTAIEISRSLLPEEDRATRLTAAILGSLLCLLIVLGWFSFLAIGRYQVNPLLYWGMIIGVFLLGLVSALLVMVGWSMTAGRMGVAWALCIMLGLQLISNTWGMAIVRQNGAQEMWSVPPTAGQVDLFQTTITDLSSRNTGLRDQLEIVVLADSPALKWVLRNYPNARFETALSSTDSPPVVVTLKEAEEPRLAQNYRGQDFVWQLYPGWLGVFPPDLVNWVAFRQAPLGQAQIILWARVDLFPGSGTSAAGSVTP